MALAYGHTATFGQNDPAWHEDEAFVAGVDGDIYDAVAKIQGRASDFASATAGAAIASFENDSEPFPSALDGFFSLFLWDRRARTLHLSTDRLGNNLFYYYENRESGLVVFSTELKAVLCHPSVSGVKV